MPREYLHIEPVSKAGLSSNVPKSQRLWDVLDGVRVDEGNFRKRPGITQLDATTAVVAGDAQLMTEFLHADIPTVEIIRPDADGYYSDAGAGTSVWVDKGGGVASYTDIDEDASDEGGTYIYAYYDQGAAEKFSVGMANTDATFTTINKLTFHARAYKGALTGSEIIRPTGMGYYSEWAVTTEWWTSPAAGGGTVDQYTFIDEVTADDNTTYIANYALETGNRKVSFTMGNLASSFSTITNVSVHVRANRGAHYPTWPYPWIAMHSRAGGTDYPIGSAEVSTQAWTDYTFNSAYNPATGNAWTTAEVDALELVLERDATAWEAERLYVTQVYVTITGTLTDPNLEFLHRVGSTDHSLGDAIPITEAAWTSYTLESTVNPATDAAWTPAEVNALELILEKDNDTGKTWFSLTQAYVTVDGIVGAVRTSSKLYLTNVGMKRLNETLDTFTDIDDAITAPTCGEFHRWDWTEFLLKQYMTNGTDDVYFYPDAGNVMGELSAKPTGRTIATYGGRLMLGDITEGATRYKTRLRWTIIGSATDWAGAGSGNMDLDEVPGPIVKLKGLVEKAGASFIGILVAYKDPGIYHIEATGDAADPFHKRLINGSVGCYAMSSVQGFVNAQGEEVHAFLGHQNGVLNIFEWNGNTAVPIGNPIRDMLKAEINYSRISEAFAVSDTETGSYVLCVCTGGRSWPEVAYVYNIEKAIWTRWSIPPITTAGQWLLDGKWSAVIGKSDALAYKIDTTVTKDHDDAAIPEVITTGDLSLGEPWERTVLHRAWVWYMDRGACTVTVTAKNEQGDTKSTTVALAGEDDGLLKVEKADLNLHGYRLRTELAASTVDEELDLVGLTLEYERQGVV